MKLRIVAMLSVAWLLPALAAAAKTAGLSGADPD